MRGKFIVLEGIDGSGTTTQSELLVSALRQDGIKASRTREPSDGPVGLLIRQVLTGKIVLPRGANESVEMDSRSGWSTMALLFAADRMDHVGREIEPALARGEWVISDRYVGSSLAYQSLTAPGEVVEALGWIANLNRFAAKPDLTVVLDVPADAAEARRRFATLAARAADRWIPPTDQVIARAACGDLDAASGLAEAVAERDPRLTFLGVDPKWDGLARDPRVIALRRDLGLPGAEDAAN